MIEIRNKIDKIWARKVTNNVFRYGTAICAVISIFCLMLGITGLFVRQDMEDLILSIMCIVWAVLLILLYILAYWLSQKRLANWTSTFGSIEQVFELCDDKFILIQAYSSGYRVVEDGNYAIISKVIEKKDMFVIHLSVGKKYYLLKDGVDDKTILDIREFFKNKLPDRFRPLARV